MVAPLAVAGGIAAGSALASYMGGQAAARQQKEGLKAAARTMRETQAYFESIGIPPVEAQKIVLRQYNLPEEFQPILEQEILAPGSALEAIEVDPRLQEMRMQDLAKMRGIAEADGMDIQAQIATEQALEQARQQEQSQREAIEMAMQRRGVAGGGLEFAMKQQAQQAAANEARRAAQLQAAEANKRALQALVSGSQMAGQLSQEDIALQSDKARAQDIINKFNTMAKQDVQRRNIEAQNKAAYESMRQQEAIQRANVDTLNRQQEANKALIQQEYLNKLARARSARGMDANIAGLQQKEGQLGAQQAAAPYEAISKTIGTMGDIYLQDERDKRKQNDATLR